MNETKKNNSLR